LKPKPDSQTLLQLWQ